MELNGVSYPEIFVKSGYYFDKASMSDALLGSMLDKVTTVDKPENLGTIELEDFSKIALTNNKVEEIDNARIEAELEKERDSETAYVPIKTKREAKMTDRVVLDFKGYMNGEELEGGSADDFALVLGSGQFIPGFEEQVAGHLAGRKFSFDITFPANYDSELSGKDARFEVVIKSIEEAITPEIDDEFVKNHTKENSITVEQYKEEVRRRIETRNNFLNNQNLIYQLNEYLMENTKFNPTEEAIAWQFSVMMDEYNRQAAQQNMTFADMIDANGGNIRDAYDEIKSVAPQAVQTAMLIDELVRRFPSTVTEDEIMEWFSIVATSMGYGNTVTYEDYKSFMGYDNLVMALKQDKAFLQAIKLCNVEDYKEEVDK